MKKFTRLTAIVISLAMILASMYTGVFADTLTFTDVDSANPYNAAIYSLVSKGIINGYTEADGTSTFKPDNTITRAEFAKLLVLATTPGVIHSATTNRFPDLSVDHWANPYIAAAVATGAINGYPDGTFGPENPVSYGEAIKMIVCTLGYGNVVTPTEPWYDGYIRMANSIKLTKGAAGLGQNEAKRGLVAQLIFNIADVKQLVQVGGGSIVGGSSGNISLGGSDKEEYEEYSGVLTAVFDRTIEGISYGLKKNQIMIDDQIFDVGELDIDSFYDYIGRYIYVEYEDAAKDTIVSFEDDTDDVLTLTDEDIEEIDGRTIIYYDGKREEEIELSKDLYVIYNGRGVKKSQITDKFIAKYFDIDNGEIVLIDNNGKKDYDVAYITCYETMFVTNKTSSNDVYKIYDSYGSVGTLELRDDECTVYKVTSVDGKKADAKLSSISADSVISIAAPLDETEGTEIIISNITLKNKKIDSVYKGIYKIDDEEYELSNYYEDLIEENESYTLEKGDVGTFYLTFNGKIAFYEKSETSEPYGYLAAIDDSTNGFSSSIKAYIFTQTGTWLEGYPIADKVKVNGKRMDAEDALDILEDTADLINEDKPSSMAVDAKYAQLIKYKLNSDDEISEIYTIDPDGDFEDGVIVPGKFVADADAEDEKTEFSKGEKLKYSSSSKVFKEAGGGNQFTINSSTIVFYIPFDRDNDLDAYKKRTYSSFTDAAKYIVEPYDMTSTTAKVVLVYSSTGATEATIYANAKPVLVESISSKKNGDDYADYLTYWTAGSSSSSSMFVSEDVDLDKLGIESGDIIRMAQENDEIVGIQKVYVGGKLYDYEEDDVFTPVKATGNVITHAYNGDADYYEVILGRAYAKDGEGVSITPLGENDDNWIQYTINTSTKLYKWDSDVDEMDVDLTMDDIATIEKTKDDATTILAVKRGSALIAIYIIE